MAGTFTTSGANTTLDFKYTATTSSILSILGDAAELIYSQGVKNVFTGVGDQQMLTPFASLTNQQKVDVVDEYFKQIVINAANTMKANRAADVARLSQNAALYTLP